MLIKTSDFRPIQIGIENEDEFHQLVGLLSFAAHNHPNKRLLALANRLLDDLINTQDEVFKHE